MEGDRHLLLRDLFNSVYKEIHLYEPLDLEYLKLIEQELMEATKAVKLKIEMYFPEE